MRGQVTEVLKVYGMQERQLIIPVYQRNYDWGHKQCQQLLDDLVDLIHEERPKHFFGAVVGQPESSWEWVVIDGQQRLTTVSLLMLALADLLDERTITSSNRGLSARIRSSFLVLNESGDTPRFKLKPVKNDAKAYESLFGPGTEHIDTSSVTANYRFFKQKIPDLSLDADSLWAAIERLEVMHLDLEGHDDAQRIFESLNSTGLALSEADKIRNLVLMGLDVHEQERVYEQYWNAIELNVDYDTGSFLRWFLVTKTPRTPRRDEVYEAFKAYAAEMGTTGAELLGEVRRFSRYFRQVRTADTGNTAVDLRLRRLKQLNTDVVLPLLMSLLDAYESEKLFPEDLVQCLRIVESYIFRRYVGRVPTNALNKVFATIYRDVTRLKPEGCTFAEVLGYSLRRRSGSGWFPDNEAFSEAFTTGDLYHFHGERRNYLFECLENLDSNDTRDIANGLERGTFTVEHVMPQALSDAWRATLGPHAEETHGTWLHRIGNLTVTGYNSAYSNASYETKKTMANGLDESPFRLNKEMRESATWNVEQLEARTKRLLRDALSYWTWPETDFEPPRPQLPTEPLGTETDFTGRDAVGFTWNEHHTTIQNWRDLTTKVFQIVVAERREEFLQFARGVDWFRVGDEFDPSERAVYKIDEGLGWNVDSNTWTKVSLMRRLFTHLDLDPDELVIVLRADETAADAPAPEGEAELKATRWGELTKFVPVLDELQESQPGSEIVVQAAKEFSEAFKPFRDESPLKALGASAQKFATNAQKLDSATPEQIIALISVKTTEQELMDPEALNTAIVDGTLRDWVGRLVFS